MMSTYKVIAPRHGCQDLATLASEDELSVHQDVTAVKGSNSEGHEVGHD